MHFECRYIENQIDLDIDTYDNFTNNTDHMKNFIISEVP